MTFPVHEGTPAELDFLHARCELFRQIRGFFEGRGYLEVETPLITTFPSVEVSIESIRTEGQPGQGGGYLRTSPEYEMKRLLASGAPSIFQITRAFRQGEVGQMHNPEFAILEWYCINAGLNAIMDETDDLLQLTLKTEPADRTTYAGLFDDHLGLNPFKLDLSSFRSACTRSGVVPPDILLEEFDQNDALDFLMGFIIQPLIGVSRPVLVKDFPRPQSSCAQPNPDGLTAQRFEAYYKGIELCNGYHEISHAQEQQERFAEINALRLKSRKQAIEPDQFFLEALASGIPDCSGNAVGLDRLLMLRLGKTSIADVIAFPSGRC